MNTESQGQNSNENSYSLDQNFWETRWKNHQTGLDIGYPSPAISDFFENYPDKSISILIPGCGNAYEAEFLYRKGFSNISLIDISSPVVEQLKSKYRNDPQMTIIHGGFFEHLGQYDLIIEQTFFCAINPKKRRDYVEKVSSLLKDKGQLVGVLFNREFEAAGPPFSGSEEEYKKLFETSFDIKIMKECRNSIPPRRGSELFIHFQKK